ncbi:flagellar basal-body rod protein FlgC [Sulfurihydrogenibium azorense Az-Fu1]|jgi:flagellar basal-body rod protein FlgC|uniref:Flagellar basal-body rod protein FlgC n=1 Tax=Sulfurihydrogenibium azorense (strain DSM 15241 / OCM 825 / Az-Fu1) TaxID=204536 RepID=C1DW24_SULAA|nr:flagellar basal body rod protein FlgC [Sulfurihydrogenibium azorense]ACN98233.1 flagellar basal-body rod protein FlgC [Sulfurihydrogenibium azorense Az-Fu1]MDM7273753.1 flagellar basal body rod protein FlgC [Sulfurihydrogenibium azorense]
MIFKGLEVSVSGMQAERVRIDLSASNLANVNSTRAEDGQPYRRKVPVFEAVLDSQSKNTPIYKVRVKEIQTDPSPFKLKFDPNNPDADQNGYVRLPNVDPIREMVDMMSAMRSYEANLTAFNTHKDMILKSLEIIRV